MTSLRLPFAHAVAAAAFMAALCVIAPHTLHAQQAAPAAKGLATRASLMSAITALDDAARQTDAVRALTATLHDSATILLDGIPIVRGRAAVTRLLQAQASLRAVQLHFVPQLVELSDDGTLGVSLGALIARDPRASSAAPRNARYMGVWARSASGEWSLLAFALLGAVSDGATAMPDDLTSAPLTVGPRGAAFAAADSSFAAMAGTAGAPRAFGAFAAPDAVTFPGDGLAVGPANIEARMEASGAGRRRWEWRPRVADGSHDGSLGFTVGEAIIRSADGSGTPGYSKYLSLWRRQRDGSVRFLSDGGNSRPATTR